MTAFKAASLLLVAVFVWVVLSALASQPPVSIRQPGRFGSDPQDWWIVVTVEPHEAHRLLRVEVDGQPGQYRSKDYTLAGEKAARIRQHWEKALTAGCYWFIATVWDASRPLYRDVSGPVSILGRDGNLCPEEEGQ